MKMQTAMGMINNKPKGFMVHFEWIDRGCLSSDYFPDKHADEPLIETEYEAWKLAHKFARVTKGKACNIYVIDHTFSPVKDYEDREIKNR